MGSNKSSTTIKELLRAGSYFLYDFNDIRETYYINSSKTKEGEYSENIYPLFSKKIIDESTQNDELLELLTTEVPYFYRESSGPFTLDKETNEVKGLSGSRDPAIINVPSALQTNTFYNTWFRNIIGYIQNEILLDIHNKFKYPFVDEIYYLNSSLFPRLALKNYTNGESLVTFKDSYKNYLNEILNSRLQSIYNILDYQSDQTSILNEWVDSLVGSGELSEDEKNTQILIFKLQDVRHELIRRKFGGSKLLYSLALSSINRKGSFITTTSIGDFTTSNTLFKDKRLVRVLNLPGITTRLGGSTSSINPLVFYDNLEDSPSLGDLSSIYYTSNLEGEGEENYKSSSFYLGDSSSSAESYRSKFLRDNKKIINWDCLDGLATGESLSFIYPTLDEKILTTNFEEALNYRTFDYKTTDENEISTYFCLDSKKSLISEVAVFGNAFDLSADRLLFSENSYQKKKGNEYPYVTYPLSGGKSISLVDYPWIQSLDVITSGKSRVQDQVFFGAQISKYYEFESYPKGEYHFYGITYSKEDSVNLEDVKNDYTEESKYAYLWYCTIEYDANNFRIKKFNPTLISKITLKIPTEKIDSNLLEEEEYKLLTERSRGIIPFVYKNMINEEVLGVKLGENSGTFYDDLQDLNYTKASFLFSDSDLMFNTPLLDKEPSESSLDIDGSNFISTLPSSNTRTVFYVVDKGTDSNSTGEKNYKWSSPLKVINLSNVIRNNRNVFEELKTLVEEDKESISLEDTLDSFYPPWKGLCFFFNPYLNFTKDSASPLRNHTVEDSLYLDSIGSEYLKKSILKGASQYAKLGNINTERGLSYTSKGRRIGDSSYECGLRVNNISSYKGAEISTKENLQIIGEEILEYVNIYGDNGKYHPIDSSKGIDITSVNSRSSIHRDSNTLIECIEFSRGDVGENNHNIVQNYLEIIPSPPEGFENEKKENLYRNWIWNKESDGITICVNISLPVKKKVDEEKIKEILSLQDNEMTLSYRKNEHRVYLKFAEDLSTVKPIFNLNGVSLEFDEIPWLDKLKENEERASYKNSSLPLRIAASLKFRDNKAIMSLAANNRIKERSYDNSVINFYDCVTKISENNDPIYLGSELEGDLQKHCFFGSLYDYRLYKEGFTGFSLILIGNGTTRENYSFSPSSYVLGYNVYKDLGVLKEVKARATDRDKLEEITDLRFFNRSVWDSILVDMYPISSEEMDLENGQYTEDYYNPKSDSDIYGWVRGEKSLEDCIEQNLENNVEVYNNLYLNSNVSFHYKNELNILKTTDYISLVNTMLYPVSYKKDPITSIGESFILDETTNKISSKDPINLPSSLDSVIKGLSYEADVNLNFKILPESNFTNFHSKGSNVELTYNTLLEEPVVVVNNSNGNTSQNNHILIPFTIPRQTQLEYDKTGYLDYFLLKNVQLNSSLSTLLKASSYYTELRIPLVRKYNNNYVNVSKWDALRTLKEGTYYITCKYPMQIIPFEDNLYNSNINSQYSYLYASVRFKIEVSGVPVVYSNGENNAENIKDTFDQKYRANTFLNTFKNEGALINPSDNRTFPHRKINIDLYAQQVSGENLAGQMKGDNEDYSFEWVLLGTNHKEDFPNTDQDFLTLDRETLNHPLVINREIPLFLSKNYTLPFFLAGTSKVTKGDSIVSMFDASSADDDLISPIKISPRYSINKINSYVKASGVALDYITYYVKDENSDTFAAVNPQPSVGSSLDEGNNVYYIKTQGLDRLECSREEDLDNIVLSAGRSYNLLWDYEGYVSEISYTSEVYSSTSKAIKELSESSVIPLYTLTESEKKNTARLSSLLDEDSSSSYEYSYTQNGLDYAFNEGNILTKTSGYEVSDHEFLECTLIPLEEEEYNLLSSESPDLTELSEFMLRGDGSSPYSYKAYKEYKIFKYIDDSQCETGYIYKKEDGSYFYRDFIGGDLREIINSLSFDKEDESFSKWGLNTFYKIENTGGGISGFYRAILMPLPYIFEYSSHYYKWNNLKLYEFGNILKEESTSRLPVEGDGDTLYLIQEEPYAWVKSFNTHFSEYRLYDDSKCTLGNPYSRSSEYNYPLYLRNRNSTNSRFNIENSFYFPYISTEVPQGQEIPCTPIKGQIEVIKSDSGDLSVVDFDEIDVLKTLHQSISGRVNNAIRGLRECNTRGSDVSGIFSAMSYIAPHITYPYEMSEGCLLTASFVNINTDDLYIYKSNDRNLPIRNNNLIISRRGLYSNNLILNQDFSNINYWSWGNCSSTNPSKYFKDYISDSDWGEGEGKDVYQLEYLGVINGEKDEEGNLKLEDSNENNPILLTYLTGSSLSSARYEVALNVKMSREDNPDLEETFYIKRDNKLERINTIRECEEEVDSIEDLPDQGISGGIYLNKFTNKAWRWITEDDTSYYESLELVNYYEGISLEDNQVAVDSPLNNIQVYARFLNDKKVIAREHLIQTGLSQKSTASNKPEVMFLDKWYNLSREKDSLLQEVIQANTISYEFIFKKKDLSIRFTKAVVRKSSSASNYLGLADALFEKSSSDSSSSVLLSSHRSVVFRNKTTLELLPIQFNPIIKNRPGSNYYDSSSITYPLSGLGRIKDFESRYGLGKTSEDSKLTELINPWTRRLHYSRKEDSNIKEVYINASTVNTAETSNANLFTINLYESYEGVDEEGKEKFSSLINLDSSYKYIILNGDNDTYYKYLTKSSSSGLALYERKSKDNGCFYKVRGEDNYLYLELCEERPYKETLYFTEYEKYVDEFGVVSKKENITPVYDLYTEESYIHQEKIESEEEEGDTSTSESVYTNKLILEAFLKKDGSSPLKNYDMCLDIPSEAVINQSSATISPGPITLTNETVSGLINCFNPANFLENRDSLSVVTNIQLLCKNENEESGSSRGEIIAELEYPPIIYKEKDQHLSCNFLFKKSRD